MNFNNVAIESIAYGLPEEVWTSADLEAKMATVYERLHLPEGRLELMTGIKERRFYPAGTPASVASAQAGKAALAKSSEREEIDLLIHSAVCRDRLSLPRLLMCMVYSNSQERHRYSICLMLASAFSMRWWSLVA